MTYHKRPTQTIDCAHCGTLFEAAHKSKMYCCQSCNTLAWQARHGKKKAVAGAKQPVGDTPSAVSLELTTKNVSVIALSAAFGNLVAQGSTSVVKHLMQGNANAQAPQPAIGHMPQQLVQLPAGSDTEQPVDFLPADLQAILAPLEWITLPERGALAFVRLQYYGHELCYQVEHQLLLLKNKEVGYYTITSARMFTKLARYPAQSASQLPTRVEPAGAEAAPHPEELALDLGLLTTDMIAADAFKMQQEAKEQEAFARALARSMDSFPAA